MLHSINSLSRVADQILHVTRCHASVFNFNAEMSGSYTISQLHKYEPPKWASSLKNIPQHFVKVRLQVSSAIKPVTVRSHADQDIVLIKLLRLAPKDFPSLSPALHAAKNVYTYASYNMQWCSHWWSVLPGCTSRVYFLVIKANGDVPLDEVAFSRVDWL